MGQSMAYHHDVKSVNDDPGWKKVLALYRNWLGVVQVGEHYYAPCAFDKYKEFYNHFKLRNSDVFVMGFMKTGTTWVQEIVWAMLKNPKCKPTTVTSNERIPLYEADSFGESSKLFEFLKERNVKDRETNKSFFERFKKPLLFKVHADGNVPPMLQSTSVEKSPRIYKTHMPLSLHRPDILDQCKVLYVMRNPKDTVTSMHPFVKKLFFFDYVGSFDQFFDSFISDRVPFGPMYRHVEEAWEKREHPNLHFVYYEDLLNDTQEEMRKISDFLGVSLTDVQMQQIEDFSSFTAMKQRERDEDLLRGRGRNSLAFSRKGQAGDWKNHFTPDQAMQMNQWIKSHFGPLNLKIDYSNI